VAAVDRIDLKTLGSYLEAHIPGFNGLRDATKFAGGQSNPTFLLTADSGQYVLRKQPPGDLLKSAHAVDREYRVIRALADTDVPVARAYHLCTDTQVIGTMFYVMSYENGRIFWNPALPDIDRDERRLVYDEMNRVLATLHDVDIDAVGLGDFGRPGNYFERQVDRWSSQYRASETAKIEAMDRLIEWLPENMPEDDGQVSLIHGDYRLDNIVFAADSPRAMAVLDWELSTLGHPYADLAYQCMQLRIDSGDVVAGLGDADRASLGIPTEEEYVAAYCRRRGIDDIPDWNFYIIFSFFRLAAILQGVLKRAIDGNASSAKAFEYGALAPKLAGLAARVIESR
jgi:aminoglycoside phosphotransferase (APT) family kinase protein